MRQAAAGFYSRCSSFAFAAVVVGVRITAGVESAVCQGGSCASGSQLMNTVISDVVHDVMQTIRSQRLQLPFLAAKFSLIFAAVDSACAVVCDYSSRLCLVLIQVWNGSCMHCCVIGSRCICFSRHGNRDGSEPEQLELEG